MKKYISLFKYVCLVSVLFLSAAIFYDFILFNDPVEPALNNWGVCQQELSEMHGTPDKYVEFLKCAEAEDNNNKISAYSLLKLVDFLFKIKLLVVIMLFYFLMMKYVLFNVNDDAFNIVVVKKNKKSK